MSDQELGISVTIDAELARFEAKMRDAGRVVEASTSGMDRATRRAQRGFERFEAKVDPAARALREYQRGVRLTTTALDANAISQDRAAAALARGRERYDRATAAAERFSAANVRSGRSSRGFGNIAQQAGFQVGDFAVQVASGQNALRAFIQQGSQLAGAFGPIGAVIGAVGAVAGALATTVFNLASGTEDAADATQSHSDAMERAREIMDELNNAGQTREEQLRRQRDRALETARSEIALAEARLAAAETALDPETAFAVAGVERETLSRLREQLQELELEYEGFEDAVERASRATQDATEDTDEFAESYNRLLEQLDPTIAQQRELEEALGLLHEAYNRGRITLAEYAGLEAQVRDTFEGQAEAAESTADRISTAGLEAASVWARSFDQAANSVAQSLANTLFGLEGAAFDIRRLGASIAGDFFASAFQSVNPFAPNSTGFSGFSGLGSIFQPNAFSVRGFDSLINGINSFFSIGGPTSQIGTGINQVGNAIAGTSSAPGSAGLFGLGDFGTAAGLGIGTTVLGLLSGQGVGQSLLQGGLTGIGGLVGGPIGAAAGGLLGNLFGGLFGGGRRPPDSTSVFDLNVATGGLTFRGGKGGTSEQEQAARQILQQLSGFQSVLEALDASLDVTSEIMIGFSSKYSDFINVGRGQENIGTRNDPQAVLDALFDRLVPTISGLDPAIQRILSQSSANDFAALAQELAEAGQFLELYNSLVDQATLSQGEIAIQAIEEQFEALFEQAERMGLALEPLIELRDREIAAIEAQTSLQPQVLADTLAAGEAIRTFLNSQAVSTLSSLSPTARLAEAQSQFGANLDLVRGGDLAAVGNLTQSASALLEIGREQFASSVSFAALETTVRSSLAQLGVDLTSDASIAERQVAAVEAQTLTLADQNERLIDEVGRMREELTAIKRELREAA